jgi:hypothetical protein
MRRVTRIDDNTIEFNDIDATRFSTFTSGGHLISFEAEDLTGYSARMQIRATADAADPALVSLTSPLDILIDDTEHTITVLMSATDTADLTFDTGVYDLELVSSAGVVVKVLRGAVTVEDEVTK